MMGPFSSLKRPPPFPSPPPPPQPPFGKENIAAHLKAELDILWLALSGLIVCLFTHPVLGITLIDTGRVTLPHEKTKQKQPETQLTSDYNHQFSTEMATRHHTLSSGGDLLSKNVGMNCF